MNPPAVLTVSRPAEETVREDSPLRWSAKRKANLVLRWLRGESLDALSLETAVPVGRLEVWRTQALNGMKAALQIRVDETAEQRLDYAKRRIGELIMEVEQLRARCEKSSPFIDRRSGT
jgi:transposase